MLPIEPVFDSIAAYWCENFGKSTYPTLEPSVEKSEVIESCIGEEAVSLDQAQEGETTKRRLRSATPPSADRLLESCDATDASIEAAADMALYFIISVFRQMSVSHLSARSLDPDKFNDAHFNLPLVAHNPRGHILGIIGFEDLGFVIAQKVHFALGMKILYHDTTRAAAFREKQVEANFFLKLDEMLRQSDCVLLASSSSNEVLISRERLAKFKSGSRFINIARSSLVDEAALADGLESGHVSGAGIDVHADEPHVNPRLANIWKVDMTSHTGCGPSGPGPSQTTVGRC